MIIFHEGLPRSGKSYETTKEHIVPALKKGRKVFARLNGLNHEKFAELAGITLEECQRLLVQVTDEQVYKIDEVVENDSLVIIDELQDFFPNGRAKLSDGITSFVTQHGHRGLDIVCMGQSLADCHNIWRRRTQRKVQFLKLDMIGKEKKYKWTAYQGSLKANGEIQFSKLATGVKEYDPAYFGAYASHQDDTTNKDNLSDGRFNIFNNSTFKLIIPAVFAGACYGVYYLYSFFQAPQVQQVQASEPVPQQTAQVSQAQPQAQPKPRPTDFVQDLSARYRCKLTYLSAYNDFLMDALVVWVDDTDRVIDKLYKQDLIELGYSLSVHSYGIKIKKGSFEQMFRWLPDYDPYGAVPKNTQQELKGN